VQGTTVSESDPQHAVERSWARAVGAVVVAVSLVGLGAFGYYNPTDLVLADRLFDHVFIFGVAAALIGAWGLARVLRGPWLSGLVWLAPPASATGPRSPWSS